MASQSLVSSHLVSVSFSNKSFFTMPNEEVKKLLESYVSRVIEDSRVTFSDEIEGRFNVNVIKCFDRETRTYSNSHAYIWCSKEVYDILMRRKYIRVCDIPKKISEDQEKVCKLKVCWGDFDVDEEIDYNELLKPKEIPEKVFFTNEEIEEKTREYLEQAQNNAISLGERPKQDDFVFYPVECKDPDAMKGKRVLKMTNYLKKGRKVVIRRSAFIDEVVRYINHVRLYDKTMKPEYPKITRDLDHFEVEFPEEEIYFAQLFFKKVIIIREGNKTYIGMFDFK